MNMNIVCVLENTLMCLIKTLIIYIYAVDNFGTVVGENSTPYGILALWAVNGLPIVYWACVYSTGKKVQYPFYCYALRLPRGLILCYKSPLVALTQPAHWAPDISTHLLLHVLSVNVE